MAARKRTTRRVTRRKSPETLWRKLVEQEIKQGDKLAKALKDAKKRYSIYKRTGRIPGVR